jgi:hypothetical protein
MPGTDHMLVSLGPSEEFCTCDAYRVLHASWCVVPHQGLNWENFVPRKYVSSYGSCGSTRLGCTHTCSDWCVSLLPHCPFYVGYREDVQHLFIQCLRLLAVWALVAPGMHLHPAADLAALLDELAEQLPNMQPSCGRCRNPRTAWCSTAFSVMSLAASHLRLWIIYAPRRVNLVSSIHGVIVCVEFPCVYVCSLPPSLYICERQLLLCKRFALSYPVTSKNEIGIAETGNCFRALQITVVY